MAIQNRMEYTPTTYPWSIIVYLISSLTIFIAFVSPYWLQNDYEIESPQFSHTGLWQICFNNYGDFKYHYDRIYDGCYWTLDEEMHVRSDQLYAPYRAHFKKCVAKFWCVYVSQKTDKMVIAPRSRKTTTGWCAIAFCVLSGILIGTAMFTRCWLQAESKAYDTAVDRIGLWVQCFRSFTVPDDYMKTTFFTGCRWIFDPFTTGYEKVQAMLQTPFFVTVQVFFTFCFTFSLIGFILVGILVLCPGEDFEPIILKLAYIDCFVGWFFGFIAVIVFGAMGDNRDWMPHWEHNHLSWSFGLGVVGVVAQFVAGLLFWVESRIQRRKEEYRQSHGVFPLETKA